MVIVMRFVIFTDEDVLLDRISIIMGSVPLDVSLL